MKKRETVEEYTESLPTEQRPGFLELHDTIISAAPGAESCISYSMPAMKLHGVVVYYASWEKHTAIYPMPSALREFADRLGAYSTSKSTVRFPHGKPLPKKLIKEIVEFRVRENRAKAEARSIRRAGSR